MIKLGPLSVEIKLTKQSLLRATQPQNSMANVIESRKATSITFGTEGLWKSKSSFGGGLFLDGTRRTNLPIMRSFYGLFAYNA